MVTIKFEAQKLNNEFVIFPTITIITSNNKKNSINIYAGWLKGVFAIDINWSCKAIKAQVQ